jgi:hypothetical protein
VLGTLSYVILGPLLGAPAWILGAMELRRIENGEAPAAGLAFARVGMFLGRLNVSIAIAFVLVWVAAFSFVGCGLRAEG